MQRFNMSGPVPADLLWNDTTKSSWKTTAKVEDNQGVFNGCYNLDLDSMLQEWSGSKY